MFLQVYFIIFLLAFLYFCKNIDNCILFIYTFNRKQDMKKFFNLKELRKQKNITQEELSQILNISQSDISNYEANTDTIPFWIIIQLAKIFKLNTLNDFLNEQQTVTPVSISDFFEPIRLIRKKYQDVIYNENISLEFDDYLNLFFIERPIYQTLHKPLIFIKDKHNIDQADFAAALTGTEIPFSDFNFPVFLASNEERPFLSDDKDVLEQYPWLKESILYFKQPKQSQFFDITLSNCTAYAFPLPLGSKESNWVNPYTEFFLNTPDIEKAACAVVYSDSQLLKNCNIVFCNTKDNSSEKFFSNNADIILDFNNNKNGISITITQKASKAEKSFQFSYSDDKKNKSLYSGLSLAIQKECTNICENAPQALKAYLNFLDKSTRELTQIQSFSEVDRNKIYSQMVILKTNIITMLNDSKNESITSFDKAYTHFIDTKYIENSLLRLGKKTYKNDTEKQETFPCNTEDLEHAKKQLFEDFSDKYYTILGNSCESFIKQLIEYCNEYKCESFLKEKINIFTKGIAIGLNDNSSDFEKGFDIYLSSFKTIIPETTNVIASAGNTDQESDLEDAFENALQDIVTFARGFSLSKARKISKALQNYQVHMTFVNMLNEKWKEIELYFKAVMTDVFNERIFNEIPENQEAAEKANLQMQTMNEIIKSLKDI